MSSTRDTSHPAIGPCVASAAASLAIQSLTAARSVCFSSNTPFGGGGGGDRLGGGDGGDGSDGGDGGVGGAGSQQPAQSQPAAAKAEQL